MSGRKIVDAVPHSIQLDKKEKPISLCVDVEDPVTAEKTVTTSIM